MPAITREYLLSRKSALEEQHRNLMFQAAQVHGAMQDVNDMLAQLDAPEPAAEPAKIQDDPRIDVIWSEPEPSGPYHAPNGQFANRPADDYSIIDEAESHYATGKAS